MQYTINGKEITCDFAGVAFLQSVHETTGEDWIAGFDDGVTLSRLTNIPKYVYAGYVSHEKRAGRTPVIALTEFEQHFAVFSTDDTIMVLRNVFIAYGNSFTKLVETMKQPDGGE